MGNRRYQNSIILFLPLLLSLNRELLLLPSTMEELGGCVWWWSVEDWVFDERVAKVLVFEEEDGFSFCIFVYLNTCVCPAEYGSVGIFLFFVLF
jgi:hypothetical protein